MSWRDQFREDNELLFRIFFKGWRGKLYVGIAILTYSRQIALRWPACEGTIACGVSFAKGVLWATAWPFYWINDVTGWVLFKPFG
jgi:hypothetical protein